LRLRGAREHTRRHISGGLSINEPSLTEEIKAPDEVARMRASSGDEEESGVA
jgi:hypothetical protein